MSTTTATKYDPVKYKTPTGTTLTCKGWVQEAALRMLLNNLNPEVAERPDDLIVYGVRGKAARNEAERSRETIHEHRDHSGARSARPQFF